MNNTVNYFVIIQKYYELELKCFLSIIYFTVYHEMTFSIYINLFTPFYNKVNLNVNENNI